MKLSTITCALLFAVTGAVSQVNAALPDPGMEIVEGRTALLITDPQNDFLSPDGVAWGVVGKNVTANNTIENIETLLKAAKDTGMPVFISPHLTTIFHMITAGNLKVRLKSLCTTLVCLIEKTHSKSMDLKDLVRIG
jgi:hypothetical protein